MRSHSIEGVHKTAKVHATIPAEDNPSMPDLIWRRFELGKPDVAWVFDVTYIQTGEGGLYLASVRDLGSRRWFGYSMANHMRAELVADALEMAVAACGGPVKGIIFHGDRGSQCGFNRRTFSQKICADGLVHSLGTVGDAFVNSSVEFFWGRMKTEILDRQKWSTSLDLSNAMFDWIEDFYNPTRRHSEPGNISPIVFERRHQQTATAA